MKKQEKLIKSIVNLYSFVRNVFFEGMDKPTLMHRVNRKEGMFLERQGLHFNMLDDYVKKTISHYVDEYFVDYKVSPKIFNKYETEQKKHLVDLSESINVLKEKTIRQIYERFFRLSRQEKSYIEIVVNLENAVNEVISSTEKSIKNTIRQIGYSMLLYDYEKKGFNKYRLISNDDACDECK